MPIGQPPSPGTPPQTVYGLSPAQVNELNRQLAMGEATQRATTGNPMFAELFEGSFAAGYIPPVERNWQPVELSSGTVNADGTYNGWWNVTNLGTHENQTVIRIKPASGQRLAMGQYYLGFFSHYDEVEEVAVFQVLDSSPATQFTWTATKTANYSAALWEWVVCNISGGGFTVSLPALSTASEGDEIRVTTLAYATAGTNRWATVAPSGTDKINGINTSWIMCDSGLVLATGTNNGGDWRFVKAGNSDVGWSVSRYLTASPPV